MRGLEQSLAELVREEEACVLDLHCYERIEDEEAERTLYSVVLQCVSCKAALRFVASASTAGIHQLAALLQTEVDLVCRACVKSQ